MKAFGEPPRCPSCGTYVFLDRYFDYVVARCAHARARIDIDWSGIKKRTEETEERVIKIAENRGKLLQQKECARRRNTHDIS